MIEVPLVEKLISLYSTLEDAMSFKIKNGMHVRIPSSNNIRGLNLSKIYQLFAFLTRLVSVQEDCQLKRQALFVQAVHSSLVKNTSDMSKTNI